MNDFFKLIVESAKEVPSEYFAPIRGAIRGAIKGIKEEYALIDEKRKLKFADETSEQNQEESSVH